MRPQKVHQEEMLQGLMSVLRSKGFDGSSLNDLAEATGLKKASLYHRFPGGKMEMTKAVLDFVDGWVQMNIYDVLVDKRESPQQRLVKALKNINNLYHEGEAICISRALSMETGMELFGDQIESGFDKWVESFTHLGMDLGWKKSKAEEEGLKTLIGIQGSLVVSKGLRKKAIFQKNLEEINNRYLEA